MANRNVRITRKNGKKPHIVSLAKTTSQAFDRNSLVEFASGLINPADDNDVIVYGVILQEVASTDSDYATAGAKKLVEVIEAGDEVEMDCSTTLTVGTSYGISNAYTVDQADTTNDVFTCIRAISATRAAGIMKSVSGGNTI
jgi:hypothetical protein